MVVVDAVGAAVAAAAVTNAIMTAVVEVRIHERMDGSE